MKTPRQAFVMGAFWTVIGVSQLMVALGGQGHVVGLAIGATQIGLGIGYLTSAAAQYRRARSGTASADT